MNDERGVRKNSPGATTAQIKKTALPKKKNYDGTQCSTLGLEQNRETKF